MRNKSYQQLQPEDRVTVASLLQQHFSIRDIARLLARAPSTISRELKRNTTEVGYASATAQHSCVTRRQCARSKPKLHKDSILFGVVEHFLRLRWSPEQI